MLFLQLQLHSGIVLHEIYCWTLRIDFNLKTWTRLLLNSSQRRRIKSKTAAIEMKAVRYWDLNELSVLSHSIPSTSLQWDILKRHLMLVVICIFTASPSHACCLALLRKKFISQIMIPDFVYDFSCRSIYFLHISLWIDFISNLNLA